ncbi:metallophosphoesterase [Mycoplasma sp. P36-A1]|uniref:metallophosphoesterase n=1 Tax=Mycoplasma sp. P36-A1 TaxID=3252900 RepID=UPI003C2AB2A6
MLSKKNLVYMCIGMVGIILLFIIFFTIPSNYQNKIKVNETTIDVTKDKEIANKPISIAVLSDFQIGSDYTVEQLNRVITRLNSYDPDIVVFNGDILGEKVEISKEDKKALILELEKIKPLYGKFAITGDQDGKTSKEILFSGGFEQLENKTRNINLYTKNITISGLLSKDYEKTLDSVSDKTINLAFIHNPTPVDKLVKYNLNAVVTAHTLGGQYNLPLFGSVYSDIKAIPYYKGSKVISDTLVINNNGIGTKHGDMRFRAPSTIDLLYIKWKVSKNEKKSQSKSINSTNLVKCCF